jgi:hypothetical protein
MQTVLIAIIFVSFGFTQQRNSNYKHELSIGINSSNFVSTDSKELNGYTLSYHKILSLRSFTIKYGLQISRKNTLLSDRILRSDDFDDGTTSYLSDIKSSLIFFELNTIACKEVYSNQFITFSPFIGFGFSIFVDDKSSISHKETYYNNQTVLEYDYRYANEAYFVPLKRNSGYIYHLGGQFLIRSYYINIMYSRDLGKIERINTYLVVKETMQTISVNIGKRL